MNCRAASANTAQVSFFKVLKQISINFTFTLPCVVIDFFLNNQLGALIIQIYSVIKLHVSGAFSAYHHEFSTVRSAPLPSRVRMEQNSILTLLGSGHQKLA